MRRRKAQSWTVASRPWRRAAGVLITLALAGPPRPPRHRRGASKAALGEPIYRRPRDSGRWDQGPGRWRRVAGAIIEHDAPRLKLSPATILALWVMSLTAIFIAGCVLFLVGAGIYGALSHR